VNPELIELLINLVMKNLSVLGKLSRGEEITEEELELESYSETLEMIKIGG
jgi:hypothetical protein